MIPPKFFFDALTSRGIRLFAGVPDSLLKIFCAYANDHAEPGQYIITANEGNAVALAAGYYLATSNISAVFMQNSGLGNCVNPLTSLTDPEVYGIPVLLIIGWRGEPGLKDEPQHVKQGRITPAQLDILGIPYWIVEAGSDVESILNACFEVLKRINAPVALLVREGSFGPYDSQQKFPNAVSFRREDVLREIIELADARDLFVSTTGKTSRELFELRSERGEAQRDFLTVGSMGHTSSIALGVALGNPRKRVICLDGDGSILMHMGALAIIGSLKPANLVHVLLNNAAHESVGGQPTVAGKMDFAAIAKACGYRGYHLVTDPQSLKTCWQRLNEGNGPHLLEIRIVTGSREDLGRPTTTPEQNKRAFMEAAHV
ncbi:MAG: phosphonopyruvate decarboxylase [Deltaproteobacteria bacterium]|nr:phosphonopyruvate decarboxylase [Deltaproteobacteria bacterium]